MRAARDGDAIVVTLSPAEAHVLIWGGPEDVCDNLDWLQQQALVAVEDKDFSDEEYQAMMDGIDASYDAIRAAHKAAMSS